VGSARKTSTYLASGRGAGGAQKRSGGFVFGARPPAFDTETTCWVHCRSNSALRIPGYVHQNSTCPANCHRWGGIWHDWDPNGPRASGLLSCHGLHHTKIPGPVHGRYLGAGRDPSNADPGVAAASHCGQNGDHIWGRGVGSKENFTRTLDNHNRLAVVKGKLRHNLNQSRESQQN